VRDCCPPNRPDTTTGLDLPGLLTLSPAVLMVVTPLVLGHELGWPVWGWAMLAGGITMAVRLAELDQYLSPPP
jgi:hypothetical protein